MGSKCEDRFCIRPISILVTRYESAIEDFKKIISLDKPTVQNCINIINCFIKQKNCDYDKAIQFANEAIESMAGAKELLIKRALIHYKAKLYTPAKNELESLVDNLEAEYYLGKIMIKQSNNVIRAIIRCHAHIRRSN